MAADKLLKPQDGRDRHNGSGTAAQYVPLAANLRPIAIAFQIGDRNLESLRKLRRDKGGQMIPGPAAIDRRDNVENMFHRDSGFVGKLCRSQVESIKGGQRSQSWKKR